MWGVVVHAYNFSYWGGRARRIIAQGLPRKNVGGRKVSKVLSHKTSRTWWLTPILQATWDVEVGGSWSRNTLGRRVRHLLDK
jgi:hypothetical protein